MLATQYAISLPADYDMGLIRRRVAERGYLLDQYPGLRLKAYLVQDVGHGARHNQYAPFYLWADTGAAASFFWGGGGFGGIVRDFGRPTVSTWVSVEFRTGPACERPPVAATLERRVLPAGEDPTVAAERLRAEVDDDVAAGEVHSMAAAIDPVSWEAVVFTLYATVPPRADGAATFEVLHLSAPSAAADAARAATARQ